MSEAPASIVDLVLGQQRAAEAQIIMTSTMQSSLALALALLAEALEAPPSAERSATLKMVAGLARDLQEIASKSAVDARARMNTGK